jgi:predicted nucleotidyltransferase
MDKKKSLVEKLKKFKERVNKDMHIDKLILFGSMATGKTHKWSDVDLIIVSPQFRKMNFFERGAKMYDYWDLKLPVDFLCFTPEEFRKKLKGVTIAREASKEGIAI